MAENINYSLRDLGGGQTLTPDGPDHSEPQVKGKQNPITNGIFGGGPQKILFNMLGDIPKYNLGH